MDCDLTAPIVSYQFEFFVGSRFYLAADSGNETTSSFSLCKRIRIDGSNGRQFEWGADPGGTRLTQCRASACARSVDRLDSCEVRWAELVGRLAKILGAGAYHSQVTRVVMAE